MTTDNAANFVKAFTQFQPVEVPGLVQLVMEKEPEVEEETQASGMDWGEESDDSADEDTPDSDDEEDTENEERLEDSEEEARTGRKKRKTKSKKKKGRADPKEINIELDEPEEEPQIIEAEELLEEGQESK